MGEHLEQLIQELVAEKELRERRYIESLHDPLFEIED